jgi:hypothetical protein
MMSCLVNIPQYLEKRLFYKYVVQKPREMKKLHEMIGSYENGNRVLNVQCLDETQRKRILIFI